MNTRRLSMFGAGALGLLLVSSLGAQTSSQTQNDQDRIFVQRASQSDFNEIKLSQLAAQNASNPDVKSFANRMVTDHTTLEQQMKPFADQMGVQPATSLDPEHQTEYDKLGSLSGKDFDKEYMTCMVKDHQIALNDFIAEQQTTKDSALKQAVQQGRKVISEHSKMANRIGGKLGVKTATQTGSQPS